MLHVKKFPRTPHLPFSLGMTSDDKMISPEGLLNLQNASELIVTEKMDGSNYNMTVETSYARSIDGKYHSWDAPAKAIWANIKHEIPPNIRLSGESMLAARSVSYSNLDSPFLLFAVWEEDMLLSWDDTVEWAELLGLSTVPVLYRGDDFSQAVDIWSKLGFTEDTSEGFVIRSGDAFSYYDYGLFVGKYVRANHVRTSADWRHRDDYKLNTFKRKES